MTQIIPPCFSCKNYLGDFKCKAFPKGIPEDIKTAKNPHTEPKKDQDNNIVYERNE